MSKKNQISFIAQHRRGSIVFFPLFPLAAAIGLLIVLLTGKDQNQFVVLLTMIIGFSLFSFAFLLFSLFNFVHKLSVVADELILTGIAGIIKKVNKNDINKIVFHSYYGRSNVPYLIIEDKLSENKLPNSIINKKSEFIKLDCNKERVKIITNFWGGEIEGLPEKFKTLEGRR